MLIFCISCSYSVVLIQLGGSAIGKSSSHQKYSPVFEMSGYFSLDNMEGGIITYPPSFLVSMPLPIILFPFFASGQYLKKYCQPPLPVRVYGVGGIIYFSIEMCPPCLG